jgi:hypothetical protein
MAFDTAGEMERLKAVADEKGDDFIIQVFRQDTMTSAQQDRAATFGSATVAHFATPETWIPEILGGGYYRLAALHATDTSKVIAMISGISIQAPRKNPPNFAAVDRDDWQGPKVLKYPKRESQQAAAAIGPFVGSPGAGTAPQVGSGARDQSPGGGSGASSIEAQLALINFQRQHDAEALRLTLEAQAKAQERQFSAFMEMVKAISSKPAAPPPPPDKPLIDQIVPLVAAFTPLVTVIMGQRKDDAKAALEREAKREERAALDRAESMKMLLSMNEKASAASGDLLKVVSPMVDAVAQMGRTVLQNVTMLREIQGEPPEEEGLTGVLKEGIRALGPALGDWLAAKEAAKAGATPAPQPPRQLPPGQPPQNGATAPQAPAPEAGDPDDPTDEAAPPDFATVPAADLLNGIETAVREHIGTDELAGAYLDSLTKNAGVRDAVNAAGGTLPFFQKRLGPWIMDPKPGKDGVLNSTYLRSLVGALKTAAQQRGIQV